MATEYDDSCCNEDDALCSEAPGLIEDINLNINLNSATIDWQQPCGISNIWIYRLLEDEDDEGIVIPSPFIIENLNWGVEYTYYLKTINTAGYSITEINFTTEDEPFPGGVVIDDYESGEAEISLSWTSASNINAYNIIKDDMIIAVVDSETTGYLDSNISYYPDTYSLIRYRELILRGMLVI